MSSRPPISLRLHLLARRADALRLRPDEKPSRPAVGSDATCVVRYRYATTVFVSYQCARLPVRLLHQQELEGSRNGAVAGAPAPGQRGAGALPYRDASVK